MVSSIGLVFATATLVRRLRDAHVQQFERLGRPSPFYFVGVQWMFSDKLAEFVFSGAPRDLKDSAVTISVWWVRGFSALVLLGVGALFVHSVT